MHFSKTLIEEPAMPGTSGATGPQITDGKLHTFIIVQCITGIAEIII